MSEQPGGELGPVEVEPAGGALDAVTDRTAQILATTGGWLGAAGAGGEPPPEPSGAGAVPVSLPGPGTPLRVARALQPELRRDGTALRWWWRDGWWTWTGTHWAEEMPGDFQSWLYLRLEHATWTKPIVIKGATVGFEEADWNPNRKTVGEVERALQAVCALDADAAIGTDDGRPAVPVANGVLVRREGEDGQGAAWWLEPHDPARAVFGVSPVGWADQAGCPRWLAFLREVMPDDASGHDLLQEWFGYVLSGRTDLHKMLVLTGPRRCGKGTIDRLLKYLVGLRSCASPTLSNLGTNFGLAPLIGRRLAVIADARVSGRVDVQAAIEKLLAVTGEDAIDVDRKNRPAWTGTLGARIMWVSNEPPSLRDTSGAMASRMLLLGLTQSFLGREDPALGTALRAEAPGVLRWALTGLERLLVQGRFTAHDGSATTREQVEEHASPAAAFVAEECVQGPDRTATAEELFLAWMIWHGDVRDTRAARTRFGMDLRTVLPAVRRERHLDAATGRRAYAYHGVGLRTPMPAWAVDGQARAAPARPMADDV